MWPSDATMSSTHPSSGYKHKRPVNYFNAIDIAQQKVSGLSHGDHLGQTIGAYDLN